VLDTRDELKLEFPKLPAKRRKELLELRKQLAK
jgi:hypothetical protein